MSIKGNIRNNETFITLDGVFTADKDKIVNVTNNKGKTFQRHIKNGAEDDPMTKKIKNLITSDPSFRKAMSKLTGKSEKELMERAGTEKTTEKEVPELIKGSTFENDGKQLQEAITATYGKITKFEHLGNYRFEAKLAKGGKVYVETTPTNASQTKMKITYVDRQ